MLNLFANAKRHSGKSLSAGTLLLDPATVAAYAAQANADTVRPYVPNAPAFCRVAAIAADAMRIAMQPTPFGSEAIRESRIARAHYLRGLALNAR